MKKLVLVLGLVMGSLVMSDAIAAVNYSVTGTEKSDNLKKEKKKKKKKSCSKESSSCCKKKATDAPKEDVAPSK